MKYSTYILLVLFFSTNILYGKDGKGHSKDMFSVFPFEVNNKVNNKRIEEWFTFINRSLDDHKQDDFYNRLRVPPHESFTWGDYSHRIFFHWGFDAEPWSEALESQTNKQNWSSIVKDSFKIKIKLEQNRRNKLIINNTCKVFGLVDGGQSGKYARALSNIVYNVHLLGDYSTSEYRSVAKISIIEANIRAAIMVLDRNGENGKRFNFGIRNTSNRASLDDNLKAEALLEYLKSHFPSFLLVASDGFFKIRFKKQAFEIREDL